MMIPATVVIFGATGESGYRLAYKLLDVGHKVIGVDWKGCHFKPLEKTGTRVCAVDVTKPEQVPPVFYGLDGADTAVVTLLSGSPVINSQGNINVINAAEAAGVNHYVLVTSIGCGDSRGAVDPFTEAFVGKALRAKTWAEQHLRGTGLNWTIVRPGGPMLRRPTGRGALFDTPHVTGHINRIDLGDVLFSLLQKPGNFGRTLSALDREKAVSTSEEPVTPAVL